MYYLFSAHNEIGACTIKLYIKGKTIGDTGNADTRHIPFQSKIETMCVTFIIFMFK